MWSRQEFQDFTNAVGGGVGLPRKENHYENHTNNICTNWARHKLIVGVILLPVFHLLAQPFYNPCYDADQEMASEPCWIWNESLGCTTWGSTDGQCRIPDGTSPCNGWMVGEDPTAKCGEKCVRLTRKTAIHCKSRTKWLTGTKVLATPICTGPEGGNGCVSDCANRRTIDNIEFHFPGTELFDCQDPNG
jgi:hypothetical protein